MLTKEEKIEVVKEILREEFIQSSLWLCAGLVLSAIIPDAGANEILTSILGVTALVGCTIMAIRVYFKK